jgi:hypothetical protein
MPVANIFFYGFMSNFLCHINLNETDKLQMKNIWHAYTWFQAINLNEYEYQLITY